MGALRGLLWRPNLDAIALFSLPLRAPSWTKKGFLRAPSRPFADKKGFSSWSSAALRGPPWTKKGLLRAPSRPFADKKGVLAPSCALRGPSWCPSAALRGQKKVFFRPFAPLRGQKGVKVFLVANCIKLGQTPLPESVGAPLVGALRGLLGANLDAIALFSLPLRAPPWTKRLLRCSPCPSAALRGQKRCFLRAPSPFFRPPPRPSVDKKRSSSRPFAPLRGQKRCSSCPFAGYCGVPIKMRLPCPKFPKPLTTPQ